MQLSDSRRLEQCARGHVVLGDDPQAAPGAESRGRARSKGAQHAEVVPEAAVHGRIADDPVELQRRHDFPGPALLPLGGALGFRRGFVPESCESVAEVEVRLDATPKAGGLRFQRCFDILPRRFDCEQVVVKAVELQNRRGRACVVRQPRRDGAGTARKVEHAIDLLWGREAGQKVPSHNVDAPTRK
eukprot:CAMPEP_0172597918 /NCGR_PEP_ID=MMETSP1068-20121228/17902_1 /TAXON_ID=35684 /ORGANISM="Pseudopedinella elastica, Strain CCMP716" /LENGTH=186 /DNA_ID=CAMNT_0013397581 /DNA_START=176 /DNA_END=737 /DNA_ORIENTATION=+